MIQMLAKILAGILLFAFVNLAYAQPNYPAPTGIWCSCPPTTGIGDGSVDPVVASKPYVNGILVRVVWKDIEPTDNTYNWTLIDEQISAAQSYGKKISIAVGGGPNSPNWLYSLGVQALNYSLPFNGTIPVPWDTIFLDKWTEFIAELGNRYQNDTTIQLVYITNSSQNGFEMQIPYNPSPSYASVSYTDQKMIESWEQVIDAFNSSFPNHYLTNDFHPVNSSDMVGDSIYNYAKVNVGSRYGANAWWWSQNNTSVYPSQYTILQNSANTNLFTGLQMVASGISNPTAFGSGGLPDALNLAISNNVCYWEIWNTDITDGSFDSLFSNAVCSPILEVEQLNNNENVLTVFPNPSKNIFTVILKNNYIEKVEVINDLGQIVFEKENIKSNEYLLDIRNHIDGIYFLKITDNTNTVSRRKVILLTQ